VRHRPALVDGALLGYLLARLKEIVSQLPVIFSAHPRTRKVMARMEVDSRVRVLDPVGYFEFPSVQADGAAVLTSSHPSESCRRRSRRDARDVTPGTDAWIGPT
jgi:UDP-N-acetylglucosamine 2-epimerase (non-hydrolysing)